MFAFSKNRRTDPNRWKAPQTWLAPKLDRRVRIFQAVQTEESNGGLEQTYTHLRTRWMGVKVLSHNAYMRWSSVEAMGNISHEFIARVSAFDGLNVSFSSAFGAGFDTTDDLNQAKSNLFFMMEATSTTGKFFKVKRAMNIEEKGEYLSILCEEIEEFGTGAP